MKCIGELNARTVYHQSHFVRRVRISIDQDGDLFKRRPFQVTWFASQESMWVAVTAAFTCH